MRLILLPAVDVVEGRAVRLVQGKAGSETEYGSALDAALNWQRDGAEWVHLVDLDAAFGRGSNRELLAEVVGKLDVHVELSGGIRDDESLSAALATGCARVNLGTAALENPTWCAQVIADHGDKVAVGLDVQVVDGDHRLRGRGWETDGGDLWEVLERPGGEAVRRRTSGGFRGQKARRRFRHQGRSGHRTPSGRRAGVGDGNPGARRGVRWRSPRLAVGLDPRPGRWNVQLRRRVADGGDTAGPAARRRSGGGIHPVAVHERALRGGVGRPGDEKWCAATAAGPR